MPKSVEEQKRRAKKYSRRNAVLRAMKSQQELDRVIGNLLKQLRSSSVPKKEREELEVGLRKVSDITRKHSAIWAIVDALEASETK